MSSNEKDDEMICGLTADERNLLQLGLNELPDAMPPRAKRRLKVCSIRARCGGR